MPTLFLALIFDVSFAQITITPTILELEAHKNSKKRFNIMVKSHSEDDLSQRYILTVENMDISREGMPRPIRGDTYRGCASWMAMDSTDFMLRGGEHINISGIIRVPPDVDGGYYAFLSVTGEYELPEAKPFKDRQLSLGGTRRTKFGAVILLNIKSRSNTVSLVLDSLAISPPDTSGYASLYYPEYSLWKCDLPIINTGNTHTIAKGMLTIWSSNGQRYEQAELKAGSGYILPEKTRLFHAYGKRPIVDGSYVVSASVHTREGKTFHKQYPIFCYKGKISEGEASEEMKKLIELLAPQFVLDKYFKEYNIEARALRSGHLSLISLSEEPVVLYPHILQWTLDMFGRVMLLKSSTTIDRSFASWIDIAQDSILLAPKRRTQVKFKIACPDEVDGEYYAAINFTKDRSLTDESTDLLQPTTALLAARSKKTSASKAEFHEVKSISTNDGGRKFLIGIKNKGNCRCIIQGRLNLLDKNHTRIGDPLTFGGNGAWILPEAIRAFELTWQDKIPPGDYITDITMTYVSDGEEVRKLHRFSVYK